MRCGRHLWKIVVLSGSVGFFYVIVAERWTFTELCFLGFCVGRKYFARLRWEHFFKAACPFLPPISSLAFTDRSSWGSVTLHRRTAAALLPLKMKYAVKKYLTLLFVWTRKFVLTGCVKNAVVAGFSQPLKEKFSALSSVTIPGGAVGLKATSK